MADPAESMIGNDFKLQIGDGASPEVFSDFNAIFDVGELGEESPLVQITTLVSSAEEYRTGLADGLEIPLQGNFTQGDTQLRSLYTAFKNDTLKNFQLVTKDSPQDVFSFSARIRGWRIPVAAGSDRVAANFTLKISGSVTWTEG